MIKDFAVVGSAGLLRAAHAVSFDGMRILLDPVHDVEIVDVLLDDMIAADPGEVIPILHLVLHLAHARLARMFPWTLAVPIATHGCDVADRAVMQPLEGFDITGMMAALQADCDFQILLLGDLGGGEHTTDAGAVHGERFFRENMFARVDRCFQMDGPDAGRRGEDDDIRQFNGLW